MTKKNNIILLLIISVVAGCSKTDIDPNIIFKNASVYTVNKEQPWASSVVIQNEKIIFVGSDDDAAAFTNKNSQIIDLNKKMILPGFHDIHVHPVHGGVTFLQCNLTDIRGIDNLLSKIKNCAEEKGPNEWVLGGGWAVDNFSAMNLPDKTMLDAIVPDKPVSLKSSDGHSLWANSIALEISNINESTIDPKNGAIERYPNSREPSGLLHEDSAMMLVMDNHPELTNNELIDGLKYSRDEFHRLGITGVQDALLKLDPGDPYFGLDAYNYLDDRNELNLHVVTAMFWNNGQPLKPQLERFKRVREKQKNSKNVKATSIKIWQDGVIETYTAAMKEPYSDRVDLFSGELQNQPSKLNAAIEALDAEGFQIHFHAIGDYAIEVSFDSLQNAREKNGKRDSRHHISHIEVFQEKDISRFNELDVVANFQPLWAIEDEYITEHTWPKIGQERSKYLYPIGSVKRAGGKIAFGSDWYVTSVNPLDGIETAVTRLEPNGLTKNPLGVNEEIGLEDAIEAYTLNGAYVNFLDKKVGSIEVGKQADLIVLDKNLFEIPPKEINESRVLATIFNGDIVFGSYEDLQN